MWLNKDVFGYATNKEKGKRGDKVEVLPHTGWNEMILVKNGELRFFVHPEDLSNNPIENERQETMENIQRVHPPEGRRRKR